MSRSIPASTPDPTPEFLPDPVPDMPAAPPQRRGLSPDLAEMLRQEAAHEAAARTAEGRSLDSRAARAQHPSGQDFFDDADENDVDTADVHRLADLRARTARLHSDRADPAPGAQSQITPDPVMGRIADLVTETRAQSAADTRPATIGAAAILKPTVATPRRGLLPDIEEINSSLRSTTERAGGIEDLEQAQPQRKRGTRFGFSTVMLIVAILLGLYLGAAKLSVWVPAAAPVLTRYVAVVDDARLWIDLRMQAFIAGQSATPAAGNAAPEAVVPDAAAPATTAPETGAPETGASDPDAMPPATQSGAEPASPTTQSGTQALPGE